MLIELSLIHRELDLLRRENRNQNIQTVHLKEKFGIEADKPEAIRRYQSPQLISGDFHHAHRQEKPAQLLPLQLLYGHQQNDTDYAKPVRIFYGPPTITVDLKQLGYTLNGFYLVNKTEANSLGDGISHQIETVFCSFKQREAF